MGDSATSVATSILEEQFERLDEVQSGFLEGVSLACDLNFEAASDVPLALVCDRSCQTHGQILTGIVESRCEVDNGEVGAEGFEPPASSL